jgi:hypothetical protein
VTPAVDWFIKLLPTGRPVPKAAELKKADGTMTLAELEARIGVSEGAHEGPPTRAE